MKVHQKANELIKKFDTNALEVLSETFEVWNIKREIELNKMKQGNMSDNVLRSLRICDTTLNYWEKVKKEIENTLNKQTI